jgi:hypothetical protein
MRRRPVLSPVLLLVVALLWGQLLGLAHRVLHSPRAGLPSAVVQVAGPHHAQGLLAHLLAPADDTSDCRLYDQLGHADALPAVPWLALPPVLPLFLAPACTARLLLPAPAPFAARAPPHVR